MEAFVAPFLHAARCVTDCPLVGTGISPSARPPVVTFLPTGQIVLLDSRFGRRTVGLRLQYLCRVIRVGESARDLWTVDTVAYIYEVFDREGRE